MMNIYVGNLPFEADESQLQELFAQFGQVEKSTVIKDRETGRSRGFGFVVMTNDQEAQNAIDALNDTDLSGRLLKINEARPKTEHPGFVSDRGTPRRASIGNRI
jgi:RNA recognition motif-containing protein